MNLRITSIDCSIDLPGLGKNKPFLKLSKKRITAAALEVLRNKYGCENVGVSCSPKIISGKWQGKCWIKQIEHQFIIST